MPILQQSIAKDILADLLHDEPLHLSGGREFRNGPTKLLERFVRQTDAELVNTFDGCV